MRKWFFLGLLALIICLGVWLGRPVDRTALGITPQNSAANVCVAPSFPNLITMKRDEKADNFTCTSATGCADPKRVAKTFLPHAFASLAAYRSERRFIPEKLDQSWTLIERPEGRWSGFSYDIYERRPPTGAIEVMVAFRGTDPYLEVLPKPNDLAADLSTVTQFVNPWDQFRQAREMFARVRTDAITRAKGRPVTFIATGHSLGGALAKHVAFGFPCTGAVVFNTSCLSNRFRFREPYKPEIVEIHEDRDWVTGTLCAPIKAIAAADANVIYSGDWVRNNRGRLAADLDVTTQFAADLEITIDQHDSGRMAGGMSREILCCAQKARHSSDKSCGCPADVVAFAPNVQKVFCTGRRQNSKLCDVTPIQQKPEAAACVNVCGGGRSGAGTGGGRRDGTGTGNRS